MRNMLAVNEEKNTIPRLLNKKWTTEEKYIPPRRKNRNGQRNVQEIYCNRRKIYSTPKKKCTRNRKLHVTFRNNFQKFLVKEVHFCLRIVNTSREFWYAKFFQVPAFYLKFIRKVSL